MRWSSDNAPPEKEDILFEENHWTVLKLHWDLGDEDVYRHMVSGVGHNCQHFADDMESIQILGGDDVMAGMCWWCKEVVPESVKTVWIMHNFDFVQTIDPESVRYCAAEASEVIRERQWAVEWKMPEVTK